MGILPLAAPFSAPALRLSLSLKLWPLMLTMIEW